MSVFRPGLPARRRHRPRSAYRALKRLAVHGHDYEPEQMAFKGELRSRHWVIDKWFGKSCALNTGQYLIPSLKDPNFQFKGSYRQAPIDPVYC